MAQLDAQQSNVWRKVKPFVNAGSAACFATCIVHPLDLSKVRLQLLPQGQPKPTFFVLLARMVRQEGFFSIYAGLSASLSRQVVYGTTRLALHRLFSNKLTAYNGGKEIPFLLKASAATSAGAIAVSLGTPLDVTLVRMQSDSMKPAAQRRNYTSVPNALTRIAKSEGFATLYTGLAPNVWRAIGMNIGMMACYDQAKSVIGRYRGETLTRTSTSTMVAASAVAGFMATALALPFDLIKSRVQDAGEHARMGHVAAKILKKEGPLAFWTGFTPFFCRSAPHTVIVLLTLEALDAFEKYLRASQPWGSGSREAGARVSSTEQPLPVSD